MKAFNFRKIYQLVESLFAAALIIVGAYGLDLALEGKALPGFLGFLGEKISGGENIGQLTRLEGGVRYKVNGSIVWHDVDQNNNPVAAGDSIFTGSDGKAELALDQQGSIQMLPNSMVIVQKQTDQANKSDQTVLVIKQGKLKLDLKQDAAPIALKVNDQVFKIENKEDAKVDIAVDSKNEKQHMSVSSENSGVKVTSYDKDGATEKTQEIKAGNETNVDVRASDTKSEITKNEAIPVEEKARAPKPERNELENSKTKPVEAPKAAAGSHESGISLGEVLDIEIKVIIYLGLFAIIIGGIFFIVHRLKAAELPEGDEKLAARNKDLRRMRADDNATKESEAKQKKKQT